MSKAGLARRKKLLYNIFKSPLSGSDKMVYYAMHLRYIDGLLLLEFMKTKPTKQQIVDYIEEHLKENHIQHE